MIEDGNHIFQPISIGNRIYSPNLTLWGSMATTYPMIGQYWYSKQNINGDGNFTLPWEFFLTRPDASGPDSASYTYPALLLTMHEDGYPLTLNSNPFGGVSVIYGQGNIIPNFSGASIAYSMVVNLDTQVIDANNLDLYSRVRLTKGAHTILKNINVVYTKAACKMYLSGGLSLLNIATSTYPAPNPSDLCGFPYNYFKKTDSVSSEQALQDSYDYLYSVMYGDIGNLQDPLTAATYKPNITPMVISGNKITFYKSSTSPYNLGSKQWTVNTRLSNRRGAGIVGSYNRSDEWPYTYNGVPYNLDSIDISYELPHPPVELIYEYYQFTEPVTEAELSSYDYTTILSHPDLVPFDLLTGADTYGLVEHIYFKFPESTWTIDLASIEGQVGTAKDLMFPTPYAQGQPISFSIWFAENTPTSTGFHMSRGKRLCKANRSGKFLLGYDGT